MPGRPKTTPWLVILLAIFAGCLTLLIVVWRSQTLPHPRESNRNQLMRWLVTRDLTQTDLELRRALLVRLTSEAEALAAAPPTAEIQSLSPGYRTQLQQNVERLKQDWLVWQLDRYRHADSAAERQVIVADCYRTVRSWLPWQTALQPPALSDESSERAAPWHAAIDAWQASLEGSQRSVFDRLVQDVTVYWLTQEDLGERSFPFRTQLATEIANHLSAQPLKAAIDSTMWHPAEHKRLQHNAELLMEAWTCRQAQAFSQLEPSRRPSFVRDLVNEIERWGILRWLVPASASQWAAATQWWELNRMFQTWIARRGESEREPMAALTWHMQRELLWQSARGVWNQGQPDRE